MKRNEVIQFRVSPEEKAKLERWAGDNQTISDVIREGLGLSTRAAEVPGKPEKLPPPQINAELDENGSVQKAPVDLEARAKQIYGERGVPMSAARRMARTEADHDD